MVISAHLYDDLEEWHTVWRPLLNPQHDYFFTRRNGQQFSMTDLYGAFVNAAYRITGKRHSTWRRIPLAELLWCGRTNPHMVRDMIVTHLRSTNASEKELEAHPALLPLAFHCFVM